MGGIFPDAVLDRLIQLARTAATSFARSQLSRQAAGALFFRALGAALALGAQILLARWLGATAYGGYAYALSWVLVLAAIGTLGYQTALVRLVAAYQAREQWRRLRGAARAAWLHAAASTAICSAALLIAQQRLADRLEPDISRALLAGAVALPCLVALRLRHAMLRALGRVVTAITSEFSLMNVLLVGGVGLWWLLSDDAPGSLEAMLVHGAAAAVLAVSLWLVERRAMPPEAALHGAEMRQLEWLSIAAPMMLLSLLQVAVSQVNMLVVGSKLGAAEAGAFQAATLLSTPAEFGLTAVSLATGPVMARHFARGEMADLQRVARRAALVGCAFTLPIAAFLALTPSFWIGLFGRGYAAGEEALLWLIAAKVVKALFGSQIALMVMTKHERSVLVIIAAAMAVNLAACLVLAEHFGLRGAAMAQLLGMVVLNVGLYVAVRRQLGLEPTVLVFLRRDKAGTPGGE